MTSQVLTNANTVVQPQQAAQHDMAEIIARVQAGDSEAFGVIYRTYYTSVLRYCYSRVGTKVLAEDICADTFVKALRRISTFEWQGRDFGAWLTAIARNLIFDHFKCSKTRLEINVDEMQDQNGKAIGHDPAKQSDSYDPAAQLLKRERSQFVWQAIKGLNEDQQQCIILRFFDGLSCRETAAKMSRSEGAIKTLQYRATASLKRQMMMLGLPL